MYLKSITIKGITRLYFYESFYENGKVKQRMVESLGRLDELKTLYDDPVSYFKEVARIRTQEIKKRLSTTISVNLSATMEENEDNLKNVGYGILKILYKELELDRFWKLKSRNRCFRYDAEEIFRLLVISRILFPASKKETYENRDVYFETFDGFSLDDVYSSLDLIAEHQQALQEWIFEHSKRICERDLSVSYFDCTNYYFDIGSPDLDLLDDDGNPVDKDGNPVRPKYRKRGPEKNHRPDPIVEMGLLMDRNGIPVAYDLFPGNESEKIHMRPIINRIKTGFTDTRIIFVADRGLNTSDNIYYLNGDNKGDNNQRDGYVYGQSVRGASEEFKNWVLEGGYHTTELMDEEGNKIKFIHKSRIHPKELHVNVSIPGSKKKKKKSFHNCNEYI